LIDFKSGKAVSPVIWGKIWVIFIIFSLLLFSFNTRASYMKIDLLFVWGLSCFALLYQVKKEIQILPKQFRNTIIITGILLCIFSFINIPLGFGNPPYSLGDFTLLLAGMGLIAFGILGYESCAVPIVFPAVAVLGFQLYELFVRNQDWITAPLIPFTVSNTVFLLHLMGITTSVYSNVITYTSLTGAPVNLAIVSDCTGIWSLGTFTMTALIVLSSFEKGRTRKGLSLILIGYLGTYAANHARILLIALMGYYYGPRGLIQDVHIHAGWIMFGLWLIIFWYYFFTRQLGITFFPKKKES
jgi:exosortase/archaeosortase family protein